MSDPTREEIERLRGLVREYGDACQEVVGVGDRDSRQQAAERCRKAEGEIVGIARALLATIERQGAELERMTRIFCRAHNCYCPQCGNGHNDNSEAT